MRVESTYVMQRANLVLRCSLWQDRPLPESYQMRSVKSTLIRFVRPKRKTALDVNATHSVVLLLPLFFFVKIKFILPIFLIS